jgi:hypothetical protein
VAYVSLRFIREDEQNVLYVYATPWFSPSITWLMHFHAYHSYEVQLMPDVHRKGVGKFLMQIVLSTRLPSTLLSLPYFKMSFWA